MSGTGFALCEYVVPKCGEGDTLQYGTMPKCSKDCGSLFHGWEAKEAMKRPGPDHYNKDILEKNFSRKAKGGQFSKLTRDYGGAKNTLRTPAVGQYESSSPLVAQSIRGGSLPKTERSCWHLKLTEKQSKWRPAPGAYNPEQLEKHLRCPSFNQSRTESRNPKRVSPVGPGFYNPNYDPVTESGKFYSASKEASTSHVDRILKGKDKTPAPGHNGVLDVKCHDRTGQGLHSARLLHDRHVSPRQRDIDKQAPNSAR